MIRNVFKPVLYQAVMELWGIIVVCPGPHLHGFVEWDFVGVAVNDAVPQYGRALLIEKDATTVDANGMVVHHGEVGYQRRRVADGQAATEVS